MNAVTGGTTPPRSRLPATVLLLGWTSFFTDVGSEMIVPLLPVFLAGPLGAGALFLGLIEGVADATTSLVKPWAGRWSDRAGRRRPLVVTGYGLAAAVRPLVAFAAMPWQVLAVRFADRVGKGLRSAPRDALLLETAGPERAGRAFGLQRSLDHAGALLGALIASALLASGLAMRDLFLLAVVPGIVSVGTVLLVRESPAPRPRAAAAASRGPLPTPFRRLLLPVGVFALSNSSDAFLLLRAAELGVPTPWLPILWAAFHVVKSAATYAAGHLADRLPRRRLLLGGWGVYAVAYAGFALATAPWQAWALFLLHGIHHGLAEPSERSLVGELAPAESRGRVYGVYGLVQGVAALPASLLTGALWTYAGAPAALLACAGLATVAAVLLLRWSPGRG